MGRESSRPLWFVEEGEKLLLLPISGSDSNWYRNIRKTPTVGLAADSAEFHGDAKPTEDPSAVDHVVEAFSAKYGADRVKEYSRRWTRPWRSHWPDPSTSAPGGVGLSWPSAPIAQLDRATPS